MIHDNNKDNTFDWNSIFVLKQHTQQSMMISFLFKHILLSNIYNRIEHKFYNLYEVLSSIIHT